MKVDVTHPLYKQAFQRVFISLQLSSLYVLYYDMDWSDNEIINYQINLETTDTDVKENKISEKDIIKYINEEIDFDCFKMNELLPYRNKLKMCDIKYKPKMIATVGSAADNAAGIHLAFSVYTMLKYYKFNKEQIMEWYNHLIDFCKLYTEGLTDKHVLEYFEQECGLSISKQ